MTGLDIVRAALVAMGADGLVSRHHGYDYGCDCTVRSLASRRAGGRCCLVKCVPARHVECAPGCQCGYPEQGHLVPMEDAK